MPAIHHDGLERTYQLHVPAAVQDEGAGAPLVIMLHGGGGDGERIARITGWGALAEEAGFLCAFPNGYLRQWYDDRNLKRSAKHPDYLDDVGFLARMIDAIAEAHSIDAGRVYLCGASNGAMLAYKCARELNRRIAAIGAVMGALPENTPALGAPSAPMPVTMVHGTRDPIVPFHGGDVMVQSRRYGRALSVPDTIAYWVEHNACWHEPFIEELPETDEPNSMGVRREVYEAGIHDTHVEAYIVEGGGHTWPGGEQYAGEWLIGKTASNFDATRAIWEFFQRFRRPNR